MAFWNKKSEEGEGFAGSEASAVLGAEATPTPAVMSTNFTGAAPTVKSPTPAIMGAGESVSHAAGQNIPDPNKVRCALGAGTSINGKLSFDTSVQIDGKMKGELFTSKTLIVGSTGAVEAQLDAACLIVSGLVKGIIRVTERLEIKAGGLVEGEIHTPCLVMDEGGRFEGQVKMGLTVSGAAKLPHAENINSRNLSTAKLPQQTESPLAASKVAVGLSDKAAADKAARASAVN